MAQGKRESDGMVQGFAFAADLVQSAFVAETEGGTAFPMYVAALERGIPEEWLADFVRVEAIRQSAMEGA